MPCAAAAPLQCAHTADASYSIVGTHQTCFAEALYLVERAQLPEKRNCVGSFRKDVTNSTVGVPL